MPTPAAASSSCGLVKAASADPIPMGSATSDAASIAIASPSMPLAADCWATRCAQVMYAAKSAALQAAKIKPSGARVSWISVSR